MSFLPNPERIEFPGEFADFVSVLSERDHGFFELAFFKGDKWVTDVLPALEAFAEPAQDTLVYRFVPGALLRRVLRDGR